MPRASHPLVHPDPAPVAAAPAPPAPAQAPAPAAQGQGPAPAPAPAAALQVQGNPNAPPGVLMRDFLGSPATRSGLGLRLAQLVLSATAVTVMVSTDDYSSVTAFRYFVTAAALQCIWSVAMAIVDVYAILVGRAFRTPRVVSILGVGDWITGGITFSAASASAGITVLISDDLAFCYENACPSFMAATAMAFLSSLVIAPCCVLNLGQVVYKVQRP